jgi:hypothetical protein
VLSRGDDPARGRHELGVAVAWSPPVVPKTPIGSCSAVPAARRFLDGTLDTIAISSWVHPGSRVG